MRSMSVIVKPLKGEAMTRNRAEVPQEKKKQLMNLYFNYFRLLILLFIVYYKCRQPVEG